MSRFFQKLNLLIWVRRPQDGRKKNGPRFSLNIVCFKWYCIWDPKKTAVTLKDGGDDDTDIDAELKLLGRKNYGEIASPFLSPYICNTRLRVTQYGLGREGDNFKIGYSTVTVHNMSNINIKGKQFKGTEDLWKLLTRKNVNYVTLDKNERQKNKTILEMTNARLEGYRLGGNIQTSRGTKFKYVITKLFPEAKAAIRQKWVTY